MALIRLQKLHQCSTRCFAHNLYNKKFVLPCVDLSRHFCNKYCCRTGRGCPDGAQRPLRDHRHDEGIGETRSSPQDVAEAQGAGS